MSTNSGEAAAEPGDDSELERLGRIDEIVTAALVEVRSGRTVDVDALVAAHGDIAEPLRAALRGVTALERASQRASRDDVGEEPGLPEFIGPYRVREELGRGGMGIVYGAEDASLGRIVAIKLLPRSISKSRGFVERFQREARAAARLEHSNVVPIFSVDEADGQHFIVMKHVDGHGLDALLHFYVEESRQAGDASGAAGEAASSVALEPPPGGERAGSRGSGTSGSGASGSSASGPRLRRIARELAARRLGAFDSSAEFHPVEGDPPQVAPDGSPVLGRLFHRNVARIGLSCAQALGYAHARGVLHRDIKPGNILLDRRGHVWITDFGLAKLDEADDLTREGDFVGTLRYTAPEQFQGNAEARSDVYGLGLVLYELLTQQRALQGSSRAELVHELLYELPKSPHQVRPGVPQDLSRIVMKAMAKLPQERYRTADAMASDLRAFLEGKPIAARLPSAMYLARLAFHRNRLLFGAVALLALALFASAVLYGVLAQRSSRAEEALAYRANLAAAASSIRNAETPTSFRRLSECPPALRGWEWDHLASSADQSLRTVAQVQEPVQRLRFRGHDLTIVHRRGVEILAEDRVRSISLPGSSLATAEVVSAAELEDGSWLTYHFRTGLWKVPAAGWAPGTTPSAEEQAAHGIQRVETITESVYVALAPDEGRAVLLSRAGRLQVIDLADMRIVVDRPTALRGVETIEPMPDSDALFAASADGTVHLLDLRTGDSRIVFESHSSLRGLSWNGATSCLAIGSQDQTIYLVDVPTGEVRHQLVGHDAGINDVDFSADGQRLASVASDKTLRLWDTATGEEIQVLRGHARSAVVVAFRGDGKRVVTGSISGVVKEWAVGIAGGRSELREHRADVVAAGFSANGERFATGGRDGTVRIYDANSLRLDLLCLGHGAEINGLVWSHDGGRVLSVDREGRILAFDAATGEIQWSRGITGVVAEPVLTPDGTELIVGARSGDVAILDVATGSVRVSANIDGEVVYSVGVDPGRTSLFIGTMEGALLTLDPKTLNVRERFQRHSNRVSAIRFTPDGRTLVTASYDRTLAFSPADQLKPARVTDLGGERNSWYTDAIDDAVISPNGRLVAVASHNWLVRLVSVESGELVLDLAGHRSWVRRVKFSPDGWALLSTSSESAARLWDARTSQTRTEARERRLQLEFAARALLESELQGPLEGAAALEAAERSIPRLADAHEELSRAARAVIHQRRGVDLSSYLRAKLEAAPTAEDARSALCYLRALQRVAPFRSLDSRLCALAHLTLGDADAAQARLEEAYAGDAVAARKDPLWQRVRSAQRDEAAE